MNATHAKKSLADLTINDVRSVYSGINGKCCCGCAGKHSYLAETATEKYHTVNKMMVTRVLGIIKTAAVPNVQAGSGYYATVIGRRLYIVYLRD